MSSNDLSGPSVRGTPEPALEIDAPKSRWKKLGLVVKVVELRLRFVALMAVTGLTFAYWDTIWNHYDKWMRPPAERHAAALGIEYYCPMHPQVVQDEPGSCPICGMPLAKRKKGEKVALPAGVTSRVRLAAFRVKQAGIQTAEAAYAPLTQTLSTVGNVTFDERRMATISSKVMGKSRVEKLHVNFKGQEVKAGDPLAELYSPELYQAVQELLTAAKRADQDSAQVQTAAGRSLLKDRNELIQLSTEKLERWGITPGQIAEILRTRRSNATVTILAPIGGTVVKKNVFEGQEVVESFPMFEIADLSHLWVRAEVYEYQMGLIHEGQAVVAAVEAYPGTTFPGKVEFVQPTLDPSTRTVEVRFGLENADHRLRPGMFATVTVEIPIADTPAFQTRRVADSGSASVSALNGHAGNLTAAEQKICPVTRAKLGSMGVPILVELEKRKVWVCCNACPDPLKAQPAKYLVRLAAAPRDEVLSIPESAVIDTGSRKIVYIETEPGVFEGREVALGIRVGDRYPVLDGLAPGDTVAAAGAFLIDAESRINPGTAPASPGDSTPIKNGTAPSRSAAVSPPVAHVH